MFEAAPTACQLDFDAPLEFPDGRKYSLDLCLRYSDIENQLRVEAEVTRCDIGAARFHDTRAFILQFGDLMMDDDARDKNLLLFARLWLTRHLWNNKQPLARSHFTVLLQWGDIHANA